MKLDRFARRGGNGFRTRLVRGDWNAIDDVSGLQHKASELVQQWDGLMVARDDVEERHPQDFLRGVSDKIRVPWTRPDANRFSS
jgi:hypothetical protein